LHQKCWLFSVCQLFLAHRLRYYDAPVCRQAGIGRRQLIRRGGLSDGASHTGKVILGLNKTLKLSCARKSLH
jgi:hypothetical protein